MFLESSDPARVELGGRPLLLNSSVLRVTDAVSTIVGNSAQGVQPAVIGNLVKFAMEMGNEECSLLHIFKITRLVNAVPL